MNDKISKDQSFSPTIPTAGTGTEEEPKIPLITSSVVAGNSSSVTAPTTTTASAPEAASVVPPVAPPATALNVNNVASFPPPISVGNLRNPPYHGLHVMPPLSGTVGPGSAANLTGLSGPPPLHHHPMHPMHPPFIGDYNFHHAAASRGGVPSLPPINSSSPWRGYPVAMDNTVIAGRSKPYSKIITTTPPDHMLNLSDEQVSKLISDSTLISIEDRKFVPDYLFISMGQLELTTLTDEDRIGVYRDREVGQLGLRCRHCKGIPGNGRYFPETVRSLGQSTTSATIAKHMAEKCTAIPSETKSTVKQLKHEQDWLDQLMKKKMTDRYENRPKYGSRKLFFNNVWKKMTGEDTTGNLLV